METKNHIIKSLKKRHQVYVNLHDEQTKKDPFWTLNFPLKGEILNEWRQYGVNLFISELGYDQKKAEVEMTYLEMEYGSSSIF